MAKQVRFSCKVDVNSTFAKDEYDRTAQQLATLNYQDMMELLTMKSEWRQQMNRMQAERALRESERNEPQEQERRVMTTAQEICT